MLSQKAFLRLMKFKNWTPVDMSKWYIDLGNSNQGIKYYLIFRERNGFKCLYSKENRNKIMKYYGGK